MPSEGLARSPVHRDQALAIGAEARAQHLELLLRPLAHEAMDVALARQQLFEQVAADETRRSRHEIRHGPFPSPSQPQSVFGHGVKIAPHSCASNSAVRDTLVRFCNRP